MRPAAFAGPLQNRPNPLLADVCGPTPVQMTYKDSRGDTRTLEYNVIGAGCTN
ncbi:DUF2790 domain-containing protein [Pseudomonas mohnii]